MGTIHVWFELEMGERLLAAEEVGLENEVEDLVGEEAEVDGAEKCEGKPH